MPQICEAPQLNHAHSSMNTSAAHDDPAAHTENKHVPVKMKDLSAHNIRITLSLGKMLKKVE